MPKWYNLDKLILQEMKQKEEEGCDVTGYPEKIEKAGKDTKQLLKLYEELMELPVSDDFPYNEPSDLSEILQLLPQKTEIDFHDLTSSEWQDKFLGAWLGRCAGCALGIPFEAGPYITGTPEHPGWENVMLWFQGANAWPIDGYTPGQSSATHEYGLSLLQNKYSAESQRENIRFMTTDDDIRYTILVLLLLEEKGLGFTSKDIGDIWHKYLSYGQVHSAEGQAYLNYAQVLLQSQGDDFAAWKNNQKWIRTYLNPYREWIGAQIRADAYAYSAAGNPQLAAKLAWRDASFSHEKNGIYGSMFVAAMISAAFVTDDVKKIVETGCSMIPATSRLAQDIREAIEIALSSKNQLELVSRIWNAFRHYHGVYTNNNAALVAASIIFSGGDFEKGITTAVLGGWDTDCNGATVGSILGAMNGAKKIPDKWTAPLNDTICSDIGDCSRISISECARRSNNLFMKFKSEADRIFLQSI